MIPVGRVDRHFDVRIDVSVRDLVSHRVFWAGQLLSRDNLSSPMAFTHHQLIKGSAPQKEWRLTVTSK